MYMLNGGADIMMKKQSAPAPQGDNGQVIVHLREVSNHFMNLARVMQACSRAPGDLEVLVSDGMRCMVDLEEIFQFLDLDVVWVEFRCLELRR